MTAPAPSADAPSPNFRQSELDKFGALAQRWWGERPRLRTIGSRGRERPAMDGRAGCKHRGWFEAIIGDLL